MIKLRSKIKIGKEKPQTWFTLIKCLTHLTRVSLQMCLFIGYFCLLIITTKAIIKANVMIDIPILYSIYLKKQANK